MTNYYLAFGEPWDRKGWRGDFRGVFATIEDAMLVNDADVIVAVEPDGLRLVRQRMGSRGWAERDELITGEDTP